MNNETRKASKDPNKRSDGVALLITAGLAVVLLLVVGFGGWAATARLSSAVLALGTVTVDSNVKKVQHPTGGIVGAIHVRDGDRVSNGDLLIRLDETVTRANLLIITKQLDEIAVRKVRLKAERDGRETLKVSPEDLGRWSDPELIQSERALFESRRIARDGQRKQLHERISQLEEQVVGVVAQLKAKEIELQLVQTEVAAQKDLWEKNLMSIAKYTASQREAARLEGERGQLVAANAQIKARISETELQILQIDQELKSEVTKELREAQAKEAELSERKVAAEDQLMRVEIRAPQTGVVHQLGVHTVGGVIAPGEQIMQIVPASDRLVIEARIAPQDIDHVKIGAQAFLRFTAFNQRTTPEFEGVVERVSPDLSKDAQTGQTFYVVRLALPQGPLRKVTGLDLVPGMPVEAHIQTGERTALSYLVKPLQDQIARTFKGQ